jgi:carbon storage regulator
VVQLNTSHVQFRASQGRTIKKEPSNYLSKLPKSTKLKAKAAFLFSARDLLKKQRHLTIQSLTEGIRMLVLSRKVGEQVIINDNIVVTITEIKGNRVRLGIAAPADVRVDRAEIHQRLQEFADTELTVVSR